jgi:predicted dehydrogenase
MEAMRSMGRREFVTTSLGAAVAVAATPRRVLSASDRVRLGIIGVGGRGTSWVRNLAKQDGVSITALCDVDTTRFERASELLDSAGQAAPTKEQDFRKVLDDPNVDAIVVATNHHWMGLITILACQAGKDV